MLLKDYIFVPFYLYQAKKLKRTALRLPEPNGNRQGVTLLLPKQNDTPKQSHTISQSLPLPKLTLMILGDSAAAGVGVKQQTEALLGQTIYQLSSHSATLAPKFSQIDWFLYAKTGHTSSDTLHQLYTLNTPHTTDIMIFSLGVNDVTKGTSLKQWQTNLNEIIAISQRKFNCQHILFSCVPPMELMPSIPKPLNDFLGRKAKMLDTILQQVCQNHKNTHHIAFQLPDKNINQYFAQDGFHPSALTYQIWSQHIYRILNQTLNALN